MNSSAEAISADADERLRRRERKVGEFVREEPLTALAIAGAAGFIFGGGANSRLGLALLTVLGRIALRGAATSFIVGLVTGEGGNRDPERAKARGGNYHKGNHVDARTDFRDSD